MCVVVIIGVVDMVIVDVCASRLCACCGDGQCEDVEERWIQIMVDTTLVNMCVCMLWWWLV